jgi:hypothetical protein
MEISDASMQEEHPQKPNETELSAELRKVKAGSSSLNADFFQKD